MTGAQTCYCTLQKPGMLLDVSHAHPGFGVWHQDGSEQPQTVWGHLDISRDGVVPSDYFLGKAGVPSLEGVLSI